MARHCHRDVDGPGADFVAAFGPVAVFTDMGRASGGSDHHLVIAGEHRHVSLGQGAGGIRFAVVGGECRNMSGRNGTYPEPGHLQQLDGGVIDRSEPFVLDAPGQQGDGTRVPCHLRGRASARAAHRGGACLRRAAGSAPAPRRWGGLPGPSQSARPEPELIASEPWPCPARTIESGG